MMAREYDNNSMTLLELLHGFFDVSILPPGMATSCLVTGLALDSRDIRSGFGFIALQGELGHGMDFSSLAIQNGAAFILHDGKSEHKVVSLAVVKSPIPIIAMPDLAKQLQKIVQKFYPQVYRDLNIVGVTGTNGKTTCSQYIAQALHHFQATAVMGTLGNGFIGSLQQSRHTTPDTITVQRLLYEFYRDGAKHVIMEVSSHGIEQGRVDSVPFEVAMFTNLTQDHLDYHGSMDAYGAAKRKLFESFRPATAVINVDDSFGAELLQGLPQAMRKVSYSINKHNTGAYFVLANAITQNKHGMQISIESSWGNAQLNTPLLGRFNASNLLGVLAVLLSLDIPIAAAINQLESFSALPGRMQTIMQRHETQPLVVVDYAHTPDALDNVLHALRQHVVASQHAQTQKNESQHSGKLWCVFGCGGDRDAGKRAIMGGIAQRHAEHVVLTDDNPRTELATKIIDHILVGIETTRDCSGTVSVIHDRREAIRYAIQQANAADIVIIAGKGHEDYQIIGNKKIDYPTDMSIAEAVLAGNIGEENDRLNHNRNNYEQGDNA